MLHELLGMKEYRSVSILLLIILLSCRSKHSSNIDDREHLDIYERVEMLYSTNNFEELVPILDSLVSVDSTKGKLFFMRGYSKGILLDRSGATRDYIKSASLGYRASDSYYNAALNVSFDNDTLCLEYLKMSLRANPNNINAKTELLLCMDRIRSR